MKTRLDNELRFYQSALDLRAARQQLLASNIANADTPGYSARDVDFRSALSGALEGRSGSLALATTSTQHLAAAPGTPLDAFVQYRAVQQGSVDGNSVDMDTERAAFAENALHYEASITFINNLLKSMQTAITGQ
jgi:flagellar basal-body rod protein FlgB